MLEIDPLQTRWTNLRSEIGIDGGDQWHDLHRRYSAPGLAYHTSEHIADCLNQFTVRASEAINVTAVELAIWFHDAVYDPRSVDNEERSADLAREFLNGTGFAGPMAEPRFSVFSSNANSSMPSKLHALNSKNEPAGISRTRSHL